ncbi:MAG: hypothetical protein K8J09_03325, partial [Planctomycetes bacterium]|nr:hypothetical protein [Planctomycetota bacterium]
MRPALASPSAARGSGVTCTHAADGEASAGRTTLTVRNPLPVPLRLQVELDGPAGVVLLRGEWQLPDDEARRG